MVTLGSTLSRSGEAVKVSWRGVPDPKQNDWIGLYIQGTDDLAVLEQQAAKRSASTAAGATQPAGSGTVRKLWSSRWSSREAENLSLQLVFEKVLNVRKPLVFRYMKQETAGGSYERVAESNAITFKHLKEEPLQIHIELSDTLPDIKVKFVTDTQEGAPHVRYGADPRHLQNVATGGASTTYQAADLCGYPANSSTGGHYIHPGFFHTVEMVNLHPRTKYFYQVGVRKERESLTGDHDTVWSDVIDFITPHEPSYEGKVSFITFGDQGTLEGGSWTSQVLIRDLVKNSSTLGVRPAFLLHIGDIAYGLGRGYTWDKWGDQIQTYASRYPYMVSIGNHEYDHTSGAEKDPSGAGLGFHPSWGNYGDDSYGECGVPAVHRYSAPSTGHGIWWYSFDYGSAHIVQISTEHDFTPGSRQYQWLEHDLSKVNRERTPWVILTGHRPMYNSEAYEEDWQTSLGIQRALEDLLTRHEVDLALWGHYHSYERTCRVYQGHCVSNNTEGLVHVTVGMAGFYLDDAGYKDVPWRLTAKQGVFGYSTTEVDRESLIFRALSDKGETIDSFSLHKKQLHTVKNYQSQGTEREGLTGQSHIKGARHGAVKGQLRTKKKSEATIK